MSATITLFSNIFNLQLVETVDSERWIQRADCNKYMQFLRYVTQFPPLVKIGVISTTDEEIEIQVTQPKSHN